MKICWFLVYKGVSSNHKIHPCKPMKHYNHIHLLLRRDVLAPCSGEAKARYNIVQAFFKIVLVEAWLTKSLYNELWGTIYCKGWGNPWHSPFVAVQLPSWLFTYSMTVTSNHWHLNYTWHDSTLQCTCTHVRKHGLSKPCKTSMALGSLWWDQLFDMLVMVNVVSWCQAWSSMMVCMHLMVTSYWSELLPPLQTVLIQI